MYKKKATAISLPQSKTAKIMTSAVGVESVNPDIVALATKATVSISLLLQIGWSSHLGTNSISCSIQSSLIDRKYF